MRAKFVFEKHNNLNKSKQTFVSNHSLRNDQQSGKYPLQRIQYEDADKRNSNEEFDKLDYLPCRLCDKPVHPKKLKKGVCEKCANKGYYVDGFGTLHRKDSRIRPSNSYFESLDK